MESHRRQRAAAFSPSISCYQRLLVIGQSCLHYNQYIEDLLWYFTL